MGCTLAPCRGCAREPASIVSGNHRYDNASRDRYRFCKAEGFARRDGSHNRQITISNRELCKAPAAKSVGPRRKTKQSASSRDYVCRDVRQLRSGERMQPTAQAVGSVRPISTEPREGERKCSPRPTRVCAGTKAAPPRFSFAPPGLAWIFSWPPTAGAVGCVLSPLPRLGPRGWRATVHTQRVEGCHTTHISRVFRTISVNSRIFQIPPCAFPDPLV